MKQPSKRSAHPVGSYISLVGVVRDLFLILVK